MGKKQVLAAVARAMGSIGRLSKENQNQFDNYKFTSIDDFLSATGEACSEQGLVVLQEEEGFEIVSKEGRQGASQWLLFKFSFVVRHESGESLPSVHRSVAVPWTGAQSFGSGQSYALKQFLRSLLQISTGDNDDADYGPQGNAPALPKESRNKPTKQVKGSSKAAPAQSKASKPKEEPKVAEVEPAKLELFKAAVLKAADQSGTDAFREVWASCSSGGITAEEREACKAWILADEALKGGWLMGEVKQLADTRDELNRMEAEEVSE